MKSWIENSMRKPIHTSLLLGILMIGTSFISNISKPSRLMSEIDPRVSLLDELPQHFTRWTKLQNNVAEIVDPSRQAVLKYLYTETLSASYRNANDVLVMLSIAYGKDQSDGHDVHKPDLCYPAQGFAIIEQNDMVLALDTHRSITVKYMKTQNRSRIEPLIYWTTSGNYLYSNKLQKKLIDINYTKKRLIPDGMVLRVSTIEADSQLAIESITDFVKDWYAAMPEQQRDRYFGIQEQ